LLCLTHYGCQPIGCLPGRAKTKGKVEQPFKNVEGNLLNGRQFEDLDHLRKVARWWLAHWSDAHIHRTTKQTPLERFQAKEHEALMPLPSKPYDTSEIRYAVGHDDGYVQFETNLYAIPYPYILTKLIIKASEHEIRIYTDDVREIAHHPRLTRGAGQKSENPAYHQSNLRRGLAPVRAQFLTLGSHAQTFLNGLIEATRQSGAQARRILKLLEHYEPASINSALKRAIRYHAYDATSVENILKARFTRRTLERWANTRDRCDWVPTIEQRSLDQYPFLDDDEES